MKVSLSEAKDRLPELVPSAASGERIVITRHGKPVAKLGPVTYERNVVFDSLKGHTVLKPGWDEAITTEDLLSGNL